MPTSVLDVALTCIRRRAEVGDSSTTDRRLLERFISLGDETAFATLVRRHGGQVLAACRRVLADPADVDDAFQATFLVLLDKARAICWQPSLGGWLSAVAHRVSVRARDAARRRKQHENSKTVQSFEGTESLDPSWREACGILHEELDRLPDRYRLPLVLCYLEGKSRDETAKHLGWSAGSVKGRLERGRDRLRRRLMRRGIDLSAGLLAVLAGEASAVVPMKLVQATVKAAIGSPLANVVALTSGMAGAAVLTPARIAQLVATSLVLAGTGVGLWTRYAVTDRPAVVAAGQNTDAEKPLAPSTPAEGTVTVTGRVLNPDGKPVTGATVYSHRTKPGKPPSDENLETIVRGTTDADGRFRFDAPKDQIGAGPAGDPWPVMAAADGFGLGWTATSKTGQDLTVRLVKEQPIAGRILDTEGRPVANAQVRVKYLYMGPDGRLDAFFQSWKANWREAWGRLDNGVTPPLRAVRVTAPDRDGRFQITGAGADRLVILEVTGPTIAQAEINVVGRAGFDPLPYNQAAANVWPNIPGLTPRLYGPTFDLVVEPTKTLIGVVRDAAGKPVAGARVMFSASLTLYATADRDGRFTLTGLRKQAKYNLHVMPDKNSPLLARSVEVPDTDGLQPVKADILLAAGIVVNGRIVDKQTGKGVRGGVRFAPLPENSFVGEPGYDSYKHERLMTSTDADGRFRLVVIPGPGVFMVQAQGTGESLDGQHVNPYLRATFDEEDGKHVKVTADGNFVGAGNSYETLSNLQGAKRLDLTEGAGPVALDLSVDRGKVGKLTIQDPAGRPLPGAIAGGPTLYFPCTYVLKSAECPVYALDPTKPRTLVIYHADRKLGGHVEMSGDEPGPVVVKLQPLGSVIGRLLDADGQPVAGVDVNLSYSSESGRALEDFLRQRRAAILTDAAGRFRIDGVVAGQKFTLSPRKGPAFLIPEPRLSAKAVASGAVLDLGDLRTKPIKIGQ